MILPPDIIAHCQKYLACKGCPLKTCETPQNTRTGPDLDQWVQSRIEAVRALT